jgi:5-formyltetrahydrofolate cyclo-ligase
MTITEQKKQVRQQMHIERAALNQSYKQKYDTWICNSLLKKIKENNYQTIHCYLPMGTEIDIFPLIQILLDRKITVVTPRTLPKRRLKHLILNSLDKLEEGVYGTEHPAGDNEFTGKYDLIITPGLAFDASNYRLGYGGGYYDNFMVQYPAARKIGICYPFQMVDEIPIEAHDLALDEILWHESLKIH